MLIPVCKITNTEMYKLLPTILHNFKFDLVTPEWTTWQGWFHQQKDVNVRVSRRKPSSLDLLVQH